MIFEFGETVETHEFFNNNPHFAQLFEALNDVGNRALGRQMKPKNRLEDICFGAGNTCRDDFLEIIFLAVNGYGFAASKLLRGLYERAVAIAFMIKNPDKAERLVRFAAIQEHRALEAALKVVSAHEFSRVMGPGNDAGSIRLRFEQLKPEFEVALCKKCGTKRIQGNWDLDVASMVHKLGDPYAQLYLIAYTIPNFHIHATLASVSRLEKDEESRAKQRRQEGRTALLTACHLFLLVLQSQDLVFSLGLAKEIDTCESKLAECWTAAFSDGV